MQSFRLSFHCHIDDWYSFFMIPCLHYMDFNTFRGKGADPSFFPWRGVFLLRKESFIIHANSVPDWSTWWNSSNSSSYSQPSRTSMTQIPIVQPTAALKLAHYTVWASMMRFETKPLGLGERQTEFSCFIPATHRIFISKATQTLAHAWMYRHKRWAIFFIISYWNDKKSLSVCTGLMPFAETSSVLIASTANFRMMCDQIV